MGVSFSAEYRESDLAGWKIVCTDDVQRDERTWTPEQYATEVSAAVSMHALTCVNEDCQVYGVYASPIDAENTGSELMVETSSRNGAHLLSLLGFTFDGDGDMVEAVDFKGRVLLALGLNPNEALPVSVSIGKGENSLTLIDAGVPRVSVEQASGLTWIDCGRREGYADQRLQELLELAEFCIATGRQVCWS